MMVLPWMAVNYHGKKFYNIGTRCPKLVFKQLFTIFKVCCSIAIS